MESCACLHVICSEHPHLLLTLSSYMNDLTTMLSLLCFHIYIAYTVFCHHAFHYSYLSSIIVVQPRPFNRLLGPFLHNVLIHYTNHLTVFYYISTYPPIFSMWLAASYYKTEGECWDCREYTALSDVSPSVSNVVYYHLIGHWYYIKATSWIACGSVACDVIEKTSYS